MAASTFRIYEHQHKGFKMVSPLFSVSTLFILGSRLIQIWGFQIKLQCFLVLTSRVNWIMNKYTIIIKPKAHSLSRQFCTMILFSKNDSWCQLCLGWKGLVRMIPFSKNEDHAELFTQWMDFNTCLISNNNCLGLQKMEITRNNQSFFQF